MPPRRWTRRSRPRWASVSRRPSYASNGPAARARARVRPGRRWTHASTPVDGTTRFDLASLTKVFVATTALQAVQAGALALDEPLVALVPEWAAAAEADDHAAAPARARRRPAVGRGLSRAVRRQRRTYALARPLVARVGERVVYSDLGFIALGVALARATGASLADAVEETCASVGATATAFRPREPSARSIPATEDDGWRGRVRGAVHDEKCWLMNGVAGHAGLFGTAADVARLAEVVRGRGERPPFAGAWRRALALEAISEQASDPVLRRGLGWALKTSAENSCGERMSRADLRSHRLYRNVRLGRSGARPVTIVLLTNAVYFGRARPARRARAALRRGDGGQRCSRRADGAA